MNEFSSPQAGGCIELPPPTTYWWSPKAGSNLPSAAACWSLNTGPHPDWDVTPYYSASEVRAILAAAVNQPAREFTGWYCAHCQRGVDSSEVTFHEQHQACGRVITDDRPPAPGTAAAAPSQAAQDVLAERRRQIEEEFYTAEHDDDEHERGELAAAAASYAVAAAGGGYTADNPPVMWPADWDFKPGEPRRMMVKACALLLAEIERRDRAAVVQGDS